MSHPNGETVLWPIQRNELVAAVAYNAILLSPHTIPEGLETTLRRFDEEMGSFWGYESVRRMNRRMLIQALEQYLMSQASVQSWGKPRAPTNDFLSGLYPVDETMNLNALLQGIIASVIAGAKQRG